MKVKTIEVRAKEWFDKVNGNTYFSARLFVNQGRADARLIKLSYQYGYGDHYLDVAGDALESEGLLPGRENYSNGARERLAHYCERKGIILFHCKERRCPKRELKEWAA